VERIAIFTGSSLGAEPRFAELAVAVGRELAMRGLGVVYGGGRAGLMGAVADGAREAGGEVVGVIPRSMVEREWAHGGLTELHVCETMHERKAIMAEKADAFLALPGGLGTLEEIFEAWTWRHLGFHTKPVGFLNTAGFWTPLLSALAAVSASGFLSAKTMSDVVVEEELPAALEELSRRLGAPQVRAEARCPSMRLEGCVALVTGANRGLGAVFARALIDRGVRRVYAGARDPGSVSDPDVVPVGLDVTDAESVVASAQRCGDVTLLINNAGVLTDSPLLGAPTLDGAHAEMAVNYFGTLAMCRTFAPILGRNGGGAIVNVLSVASFFANPTMGSYAASKSAAWALTNAVRIELRCQGTQVLAVHAGYIDTDMAARVRAAKTSPDVVAARTLDALEAGAQEVLVDERTRRIKAAIPTDLTTIYPDVQRAWDRRTASDTDK
jgi:uncharacterized protein (TIGR00730 family)